LPERSSQNSKIVGVPDDTSLFNAWFANDSDLLDYIESYDKDWIGPLRTNRRLPTIGGMGVNALEERITTTER
jgi:hypothetical protein